MHQTSWVAGMTVKLLKPRQRQQRHMKTFVAQTRELQSAYLNLELPVSPKGRSSSWFGRSRIGRSGGLVVSDLAGTIRVAGGRFSKFLR